MRFTAAIVPLVLALHCPIPALADLEKIGAPEFEPQPDPGISACLGQIGLTAQNTSGHKLSPAKWQDASGWVGSIFFHATEIDCSNRISISNAILLRGRSAEANESLARRAVKFDKVTFSGKHSTPCGAFSGLGMDISGLRWFAWDGQGGIADRYYEIIRSSDGMDTRIKTSAHARFNEIVWTPTTTTPCALSGKFAINGVDVRWRGQDASRILSNGISGEITLPHHRVSLNIPGVRPASLQMAIGELHLMNISDKVVGISENSTVSAQSSAAGSAPASLLMEKYISSLSLGPESGLERYNTIFGMDLSNAASLSDWNLTANLPSWRASSNLFLPASQPLDFTSVGIGEVFGTFLGSMSLDGKGKLNISTEFGAHPAVSGKFGAQAHLKQFDLFKIEEVFSGSSIHDISPSLASANISARNEGLDKAIYSLTGKTLRDIFGESGAAGISGAAYEALREFRSSDAGQLSLVLTSPVALQSGFLSNLYASSGNFSGGAVAE